VKLIQQNQTIFDSIYMWSQDPIMAKSLGFPSVAMEYNSCVNYFKDKYDGVSNYIIGVIDDNCIIRGCYLVETNEKDKRAKVDFAFDEVGRGKILRDSLIAFYNYMFNERHYDSLWGEISETNKLSYKCAKKTGWEDVCTLPDYFNEQGKYVDVHLIRLTSDKRTI